MSLPPEVKFGYVYGNRKIFDDCARAGRWVAAWNVKAGNHISDIRNHLKQLHDGRWKGAYGYAGGPQGIAAVAEWSWNVDGRSQREFLLAWATRQGYKDAARAADWLELIGPLAGYQYRSRYTMRAIAGRIKARSLPSHPFPAIHSFDERIQGAQQAVSMARELGDLDWVAKAEGTVAYYRLLKAIDRLSGQLAGADLSDARARQGLEAALAGFREAAAGNITASREKTEFGQAWADTIAAEVQAVLDAD
jgi:hypothetical protein